MLAILSGAGLITAFTAVAVGATVVAVRLQRASRPAGPKEPADA